MGNKQTSEEDVCPHCACSVKKQGTLKLEGVLICSRCGGPLTDKKARLRQQKNRPAAAAGGAGYNQVLNEDDDSKDDAHLPCRRVCLRPFSETLSDDEKKMSETELSQRIVQPHLANYRQDIYRGARLQIKGIDFKVVYCMPPNGVVSNATKVIVGKPLSALAHLTKVQILPTLASMREEKYDANAIFNTCLKPYFSGAAQGEHKHLVKGESFLYNGKHFKVVECEPENGLVTPSTEIYTEPGPLPDLGKIHLLPIYESLPNREKNITEKEIFERYFEPYFSGREQFMDRVGAEVEMDGVTFKVMAMEPGEGGLVTAQTELYANGGALRADDLKRQQQQADEDLARSLQQQEAAQNGFGGFGGLRVPSPMGAISPDEMRARLAEVLRQMPANDRHRPIVERLYQQLSLLQMGVADPALLQLMRGGLPSGEPSDGASKDDIEALPTRIYKKRVKPAAAPAAAASNGGAAAATPAAQKEEKNEHLQCMVCLSEFEDGEELRTLPCFHSFHKDCVDKWLVRSRKCPLCKTAIC